MLLYPYPFCTPALYDPLTLLPDPFCFNWTCPVIPFIVPSDLVESMETTAGLSDLESGLDPVFGFGVAVGVAGW
jgi:hypothetical protein